MGGNHTIRPHKWNRPYIHSLIARQSKPPATYQPLLPQALSTRRRGHESRLHDPTPQVPTTTVDVMAPYGCTVLPEFEPRTGEDEFSMNSQLRWTEDRQFRDNRRMANFKDAMPGILQNRIYNIKIRSSTQGMRDTCPRRVRVRSAYGFRKRVLTVRRTKKTNTEQKIIGRRSGGLPRGQMLFISGLPSDMDFFSDFLYPPVSLKRPTNKTRFAMTREISLRNCLQK